MEKTLHFSLDMEASQIQETALAKLWGRDDLGGALRFLLDVLDFSAKDLIQALGVALALLDGRAELTGGWKNGESAGLAVRVLETQNQEKSLCAWNDRLQKRLEEEKALSHALVEKLAFLSGEIPEAIQKSADRKWRDAVEAGDWPEAEKDPENWSTVFGHYLANETLRPAPRPQSADLPGVLHMAAHSPDPEKDYGWLFPNGTFCPVPWGEHQAWAEKWLKKNDPEYDPLSDPFKAGDRLQAVHRAVLVHSPSRGIPVVTTTVRLTKAQREWLYGYFDDRGLPDRAKEFLEEK